MFTPIDEALNEIKSGKALVIADDETGAGRAVLFAAAPGISAETVALLAKAGGLLCAALPEERIAELGLPASAEGKHAHGRELVASLDYPGEGSGTTAAERAQTIRKLTETGAGRADFAMPGSVLVAKALQGGVLRNAAHAEAAVDLAQMAGLAPAGAYCELLDGEGLPLPMEQWKALAEKNALKAVSMEAVIAWRRERDTYVTLEAEANLPTRYGTFKMKGFVNRLNGEHHVALVMGDLSPDENVLVRVHSECLTGDAFHSLKCDCGEQLDAALTAIAQEGRGVLLYLRQEGRGIGLINKIKAYKLQEQGLDTEEANLALGFPSDMRDYGIGAQILSAVGARRLRLMTNNPKKLVGLKGHGIDVVERVPLIITPNDVNRRYFQTKEEKMGHLFTIK